MARCRLCGRILRTRHGACSDRCRRILKANHKQSIENHKGVTPSPKEWRYNYKLKKIRWMSMGKTQKLALMEKFNRIELKKLDQEEKDGKT